MKKLLMIAIVAMGFAQLSEASVPGRNGGGQQLKCPAGQRVYVGSNNVARCIGNGMLGAVPGSNGGGLQLVCGPKQKVYVGSNGVARCINRDSMGAVLIN